MTSHSQLGNLFVISAPSGAGKTSLLAKLLERMPQLCLSISHTTRPKRQGEVDGVNYHFTDRATFVEQVEQGGFLEHAEVFGNLYGTSATWVAEQQQAGKDVILEIDWQGAQQVRRLAPHAIGIFILPPSLGTLEERLRQRGLDSDDVIAQRLAGAQEEISHYGEYDFLVVNDNFDQALNEVEAVIRASHLQQKKQQQNLSPLLKALLNQG